MYKPFFHFTITFERMLRFMYVYVHFVVWKVSFSLKCHCWIVTNLMFACLFVGIFDWAINHVKVDPFSQNLYVFTVSKLSQCTKKCDRMFDTFYWDASQFWITVFIYVPLLINLCDKNWLNYGFMTTINLISTSAEIG